MQDSRGRQGQNNVDREGKIKLNPNPQARNFWFGEQSGREILSPRKNEIALTRNSKRQNKHKKSSIETERSNTKPGLPVDKSGKNKEIVRKDDFTSQ